MRAILVVVAILAAGCVTAPSATTPTVNNSTAPTAPAANASAAIAPPPVGERMPLSTERVLILANHTLEVLRAGAAVPAVTKVPDDLPTGAFYQSMAATPAIKPWPTAPLQHPFEITGDTDIIVSLVASANAANTLPRQIFPPVGGWFGTTERRAIYFSAPDAPDTLDAGKTYTFKMHVSPPKGGFFVHEGESIALWLYQGYAAADGSAISWVVGGPEISSFALPHVHFNVTAPRATSILDKSGDLGPCPSATGSDDPQPVVLPVKVPADAVYIVAHVETAPKGGPHIDSDLTLSTSGGQLVEGASGPQAEETVTLGPGNLAAAGRDLVAHLVCSGAPAGGTYALKITAYGP